MIKKLFLALLLATITSVAFAQATKDSTATQNDNVMYKTVDKSLNIKDNIIVQNKSPYLILQIMVALPNEEEGFMPIGSSSDIAANETREIASYDNNGLKFLRGKTIAIKIKGAKLSTTEDNIKDEDVTYNFDVKLFEANHDLYIQVNYKGKDGTSVMDF